MKKNGFTLVELLAVIVVLLIVLVIAITRVRRTVDNASDKSIQANAGVYIKAVNSAASNIDITKDSPLQDGMLYYSELQNLDISVSGTKPDDGFVIMSDYEVVEACLVFGDYYIEYKNADFLKPKKGTCDIDNSTFNVEFAYTGDYQTYVVRKNGTYKIEVWGAAGGASWGNNTIKYSSVNGGYASGNIDLVAGDVLYVYVGEKGHDGAPNDGKPATFNGGGGSSNDGQGEGNNGETGGSGGGATDIRLVSGKWDNISSLASRIMVAGGAGGASWTYAPGVGGGIKGGDSLSSLNAGGTQTTGYQFGIGKTGVGAINGDGLGGGGGGYWGGTVGTSGDHSETASGGSGYISGHLGCVAIKSENEIVPKTGCSDGTTDVTCSYHYSGKTFTNTTLLAGNELMPTHDGSSTMTGNSGDGYAKITYVE